MQKTKNYCKEKNSKLGNTFVLILKSLHHKTRINMRKRKVGTIINQRWISYPIGRAVALVPDVRDGGALEPVVPGVEELRGRVCLVVAVIAATIVSLAANQIAVVQTRCCCLSAAACRVRMVKRSQQFSVVVRVETVYSGLDADGENYIHRNRGRFDCNERESFNSRGGGEKLAIPSPDLSTTSWPSIIRRWLANYCTF